MLYSVFNGVKQWWFYFSVHQDKGCHEQTTNRIRVVIAIHLRIPKEPEWIYTTFVGKKKKSIVTWKRNSVFIFNSLATSVFCRYRSRSCNTLWENSCSFFSMSTHMEIPEAWEESPALLHVHCPATSLPQGSRYLLPGTCLHPELLPRVSVPILSFPVPTGSRHAPHWRALVASPPCRHGRSLIIAGHSVTVLN